MEFFTSRIRSFLFGFTLPLRSVRLILSKRSLLFWSSLPIALTLALSIWGVAWVKTKLISLGTHWLIGLGLSPESLTIQAAILLLQVALFVLAAVCFSFIAGIVASPFNDFLAEATEPHATPRLGTLPPEADTWKWKIRAVWIDTVKTAVIGVGQLFLIFIGVIGFWIPVLNTIPFFAAFWLLTYQFVGYPQTRRGEGLFTSFPFLYRHFFACLGFGVAHGLLFAIPILSAFALPVAVVGGTLLFARAEARGDTPPLR